MEISELHNKPIHAKSVLHLIIDRVPTTDAHKTIKDIKKIIIDPEITFDSINYIYVLDEERHVVGVLSIKEVMELPEKTLVQKAMRKEVVVVHPHTHQENAAHIALRHGIKNVPVVDKSEKFIGIVPSDALLHIANDEVTEDMMRLEGIYSKEYKDISTLNNSAFHLMWKRLPWLIVGLGGGLMAAQVIGFFENLLETQTALITFLPLMVYMSDAVGSQSQTIFIRFVAINNGVNFLYYLYKEIIVGLLMALMLSLILTAITMFSMEPFLGLVLGAALFSAIILSVVIAIFIPWVLIRLHRDPAIGSGPFATILRDLLSIIVYFGISHILFSLF